MPVTLGASDDAWQAIATGLKTGDVVITGPAKTLRTLRAGMRVVEAKDEPDDKADGKDDKDAEDGDEAE